jgi:LiaI-LiaF-like transmembrane region/B-box zinc finger
MNCANHPEAPAIGYCRECGKPLCEACRRDANGTIYCDEHSPHAAYTPPPPPAPEPPPPASPYTAPEPTPYSAPYTAPQPTRPQYTDTGASPGLAFLLGFIPGVGAVYNGQYVKGLIHVVILGLLIGIVSSEETGNLQPLFGMMIAVWVFYMAFEAYHTAKRRQRGEPVDEFSSIVPRHGQHSRFPLAPTVLIAVGLIFLLHNLDIVRFGQMLRYWPIALIALGVYMLYERISRPTDPDAKSHGAPHQEVINERR